MAPNACGGTANLPSLGVAADVRSTSLKNCMRFSAHFLATGARGWLANEVLGLLRVSRRGEESVHREVLLVQSSVGPSLAQTRWDGGGAGGVESCGLIGRVEFRNGGRMTRKPNGANMKYQRRWSLGRKNTSDRPQRRVEWQRVVTSRHTLINSSYSLCVRVGGCFLSTQ